MKIDQQFRIVEHSYKNSNQEIFTYFKVQGLKRKWFKMRWLDVAEHRYPDGQCVPFKFDTKEDAIAFVKRARVAIPKDKYTYM